jgi:RNA polymerase sigma-70 factor (ECF subfamily)
MESSATVDWDPSMVNANSYLNSRQNSIPKYISTIPLPTSARRCAVDASSVENEEASSVSSILRFPQQECLLPNGDGALTMRLQQGDEQALTLLYDRYSSLVYSVAFRILRNPAWAEEVLQDIFLQMWRTPPDLIVSDRGLAGWVAVVARNRSISMLRRTPPVDQMTSYFDLASSYNLEKNSEQNLMCEKVREQVRKLPLEQRKVLEMAFFLGMSHVEIAERTGYPLGTVKTRIRRALSTLRRSFQSSTSRI